MADAVRSRPTARPAEREPSSRLPLAAGVFAVVIGVLLRSAVAKQDETDWNGVVKGLLEGLPYVLIVGGALVLIVAGIRVLRQPRDPAAPHPPA